MSEEKAMTVVEQNQFYFNPDFQNYRQLIELFKLLGNDHHISWDDAQDENGDFIYDIFISFRPVGSKEETGEVNE